MAILYIDATCLLLNRFSSIKNFRKFCVLWKFYLHIDKSDRPVSIFSPIRILIATRRSFFESLQGHFLNRLSFLSFWFFIFTFSFICNSQKQRFVSRYFLSGQTPNGHEFNIGNSSSQFSVIFSQSIRLTYTCFDWPF